jgi:hypothetical protein
VLPSNPFKKEILKMNNLNLARRAGIAGMVGAVLWVLMIGVEYAFGLQPPDTEGPLFIANQLLFFVAMAAIAFGYLGIFWGGGARDRFGKISTGMVALGYLLLIVAGIFVLFMGEDESPIFILFPIGGTMMGLGVLLTGINVARAGTWSGWQRWMPLVYAAFYWLGIEIPFIAGVYPDGPGMVPEIVQGVGLFLVALATYTATAVETAVEFKSASI